MHAGRPGQQSRPIGWHEREHRLGRPHLALLVKVGSGYPLVLEQRMTGSLEDTASVNDPESTVHAQAQTLKDRGEVP